MKIPYILFALLFTIAVHAQRPNQEQIKSLKIAHITEQLELTPTEAQRFWPIYNIFEEEMLAIRNLERSEMRKLKSKDDLTEQEAKAVLDKIKEAQRRKATAHESLISSLENKISYKKTLILIRAEESFKRKLLKELRDRRGRKSRD